MFTFVLCRNDFWSRRKNKAEEIWTGQLSEDLPKFSLYSMRLHCCVSMNSVSCSLGVYMQNNNSYVNRTNRRYTLHLIKLCFLTAEASFCSPSLTWLFEMLVAEFKGQWNFTAQKVVYQIHPVRFTDAFRDIHEQTGMFLMPREVLQRPWRDFAWPTLLTSVSNCAFYHSVLHRIDGNATLIDRKENASDLIWSVCVVLTAAHTECEQPCHAADTSPLLLLHNSLNFMYLPTANCMF